MATADLPPSTAIRTSGKKKKKKEGSFLFWSVTSGDATPLYVF